MIILWIPYSPSPYICFPYKFLFHNEVWILCRSMVQWRPFCFIDWDDGNLFKNCLTDCVVQWSKLILYEALIKDFYVPSCVPLEVDNFRQYWWRWTFGLERENGHTHKLTCTQCDQIFLRKKSSEKKPYSWSRARVEIF